MSPQESPTPTAGAIRQLHDNEEGLLAFIALIAALFLMVLMGLVANIGFTVNRKLEVQNSADAVAYSSTLWLARGMNCITATNHLIGEMQALVVIHIAIGGEELEGKDPLDPDESQQRQDEFDSASEDLDFAWNLVRFVSNTPAYPNDNERVGERVEVGATVRAGLTDLKKALTFVYGIRAIAIIAENIPFPPVAAAGRIMHGVTKVVEGYILAEYIVLDKLSDFAESAPIIAFRDLLFDQLLPGATSFEKVAVDNVPQLAAQTGKAIAQRNGTTGAIYPGAPELPVLRDREEGSQMSDEDMPKSALVRATTPWVVYDRTPILRFMTWMIFSKARKHYLNYTNRYTLLKSKELYNRTEKDFTLYIMSKPGESKGEEPWTNDSRLADKKFTVVGFAHRPGKTSASERVYGKPNGDGIVACAQAILYNANSQNPGGGGTFQPEVGWDTLNWEPPVSSSGAYEFKQAETANDSPRIRLNWQAKLVPVSRLGEAANSGDVDGPFSSVLGKLESRPEKLLTH